MPDVSKKNQHPASDICFTGGNLLMEIIESIDGWQRRYGHWQQGRTRGSPRSEVGDDYPFVENRRAPFTPARRALPMMNLALISSAGAYIDGTPPFDTSSSAGDFSFREIPIE